jgi:hypothetical protein
MTNTDIPETTKNTEDEVNVVHKGDERCRFCDDATHNHCIELQLKYGDLPCDDDGK